MLTLRHFMRIVEATVTDHMRQQTFYHGTSDDANGQSILQNGIIPGNTGHARGQLTPVAGRSYITSDLRYGVIYCIGGAMLGYDDPSRARLAVWLAVRHQRRHTGR
jgi:hypothetical protein